MLEQPIIDRFEVMTIALEVANDVVAFDRHFALLELDRKRGEPKVVWHYESGPCYAGKEYESKLGLSHKIMEVFKTDRRTQRAGMLRGEKRTYMAKMTYKRVVKGILIVSRDSPDEFSLIDVRLLKSVVSLAAAAMCDTQIFGLLKRLHLHFLDRRTAAYQAPDVKSVVEQYLEKIEYVFHPEVLDLATLAAKALNKVRNSAKLITENGTALYIAASRSTMAGKKASTDWPQKKLAARYDADGKSSITARVYANQSPYMTNKYRLMEVPVKYLFRDIKSHMSAPIVVGNERCHGVLSVETTINANYTVSHRDAFALLAAHLARPLGRARDRQLSTERLVDLGITRDMMRSLQECKGWRQIQQVLSRGLKRLRYQRGLICEVFHDKKLVVGSHYWGLNMRQLRDTTRRHFVRNKNDCQIMAVKEGEPQVVSNPKQNPAAHREAVKMAALGPFAIIPMLNRHGTVVWTLHVEREDTAPLATPEIANLQQICRAAMAARERLEDSARQQKLSDIAISWAQRLQKRFSQQIELLECLVEFAVEHICSRCRVYEFSGRYAVRVCHASRKLTHARKFDLKFPLDFSRVETDFRHNSGPIIVRPGINQAKPISTDRFKTARLGPKVVDKAIEKENIGELVQVPLFVHGQLVYIVVLDKYGGGQILYDVTFTESEIQLLGTIARLTSFALERIHLLQQVFSQASIGASIGVFAHEIAGCVRRLSDIATLYRNQSSPPESMTRELIFGVDREAGRMQRLREFFTSEVLKQIVKGPQYTTITHEVESAIALLGLTHSELVRKPNQNIRVQVPRLQRPLCLILLELLNNARRATRSKDRPSIRISFKQCKRRTPHMNILSVSDNGEGISELVAHMFRNEQFIIGDLRERGLGLHCARLLAEGQGWILRLARRRKPTRFEILIPTFP